VTNCRQLNLPPSNGKNYLTRVATVEALLRLAQSVPCYKMAVSFKNDYMYIV